MKAAYGVGLLAVGLVIGLSVGIFLPQVHQSYTTLTRTMLAEITLTEPHTTHTTHTLIERETTTRTETRTETSTVTQTNRSIESHFSGWAPSQLGLAITPDGKTAYIPFSLDDALLVMDLPTFTVIDSIDVSAAGMMLASSVASLTPDGKKLYVSNMGTKNVMAVNTENKRVEKVLPLDPKPVAITTSRDGGEAYIPSQDGGLYIINTSNDSYRRVFIPGVIFGPVALSPSNPDLLYTVGELINPPGTGTFQPTFFAFDVSSNTVVRSSSLANEVMPPLTPACRLVVNSNETLAYFGWLRFIGIGDRGSGTLSVFDLDTFQVSASVPMENGVSDFAVDEQRGKIYVTGFWVGGGAPNELPILEYDISNNRVARRISMSSSSDQRAIAIDPTNANYLYMTEGDFNLIRKVDITAGKEVSSLKFNKADIRPYAIIRGDNNTGYVVCQSSREIHKLDLRSGQLMGSIGVPFDLRGWGFYQGKLYAASGSDVLAINASDGSVAERYNTATEFSSLIFTFFNEKMATIDFDTTMVGRRLLIFNATTMSILKSTELPREPHGDKVIASPDGSKLYVASGSCHGATTITIFNASTLEITNTIEIPRHGATSFVEGDFDETNRILYLTGFMSIYKINMDTDELIGILDLMDVYESQDIYGWSPTGLSGAVLSPTKDKLFVIAADSHLMFTYDLINSSWTTRVTNLGGYANTETVSSPDRQYLYTVNSQSDSITMVDLTSGDVVRIIGL